MINGIWQKILRIGFHFSIWMVFLSLPKMILSTSSQNLRIPNSNIKNAQGIFTAINSDTLLLNVRKT
jgi:hypothetical protein